MLALLIVYNIKMPKMKARGARRVLSCILFPAVFLGIQACSPAGPSSAERRRLQGEIFSRFRIFHEIDLLQIDRLILEKKAFSIAKPDPATLSADIASSRRLAAKTEELRRHFTEDAAAFLPASNSPDAKAFVAASAGYVESVRGCVERLCFIVERLERMMRQPKSWTKPEYDAAVADYSRAAAEMDGRSRAFRAEVEALSPR